MVGGQTLQACHVAFYAISLVLCFIRSCRGGRVVSKQVHSAVFVSGLGALSIALLIGVVEYEFRFARSALGGGITCETVAGTYTD